MPNAVKVALAAGGVAIAVVLFLVLRPGDDDDADVTPAAQQATGGTGTDAATGTDTGVETETEAETETKPTTTEDDSPDEVRARITIGPDGPSGVERIDARVNQRVVLVVRSQVQDHVHVHGYDLFADVGPGQQARIVFRADVPGRYEIELEDRHQPIAELRVRP